jgi:hypothetical protein
MTNDSQPTCLSLMNSVFRLAARRTSLDGLPLEPEAAPVPKRRNTSATSRPSRAIKLVLQAGTHLAGGDQQIPRRGAQVAVPEQQLDGTQVGACLQQVNGEGVLQRVRRDRLVDAALCAHQSLLSLSGLMRHWQAALFETTGIFPQRYLHRGVPPSKAGLLPPFAHRAPRARTPWIGWRWGLLYCSG